MTRAVLSLGSNLGDRSAHLRAAVAGFADVLVAASPVYETAPWGGVAQDDFLNMVLVVDDPTADAREWLRRAQALEDASGRVREVRWGPRTLDIDIVDYAGLVRHWRNGKGAFAKAGARPLVLPHPLAHTRPFVLKPLLDIAPDWRHPALRQSGAELWRKASRGRQGRVLKRL